MGGLVCGRELAEIAVCRWGLNSVFVASTVSKRVTEKDTQKV